MEVLKFLFLLSIWIGFRPIFIIFGKKFKSPPYFESFIANSSEKFMFFKHQ